MYKEHPSFIQPDKEHIKIWRYMDFTKFISLIETNNLYFTRADKFNDPFEGSWPKNSVINRNKLIAGTSEEDRRMHAKEYSRSMKSLRLHYAINCWHENESESAAMWKLYLKSDEGIAIQSTYDRLKMSFNDNDEIIFLGKVTYIDYNKESIGFFKTHAQFMHKRRSYEHENEIRAVVFNENEKINNGLQIAVNTETLIEKVYVAPNTPLWFLDLVRKAIETYKHKFEVIRSKMDSSAIF